MGKKSELLTFLDCERLDKDIFRGQSKDFRTGQVYGGQVLGQAIKAATKTVDEGRRIRSAHAYFLRRGDVNAPIIYRVQRSLDGSSISSRRVEAIQHGKEIFLLSASFHDAEDGLDYAEKTALPLESLNDVSSHSLPMDRRPMDDYIEIYHLQDEQKTDPKALQMWIKAKDALPADNDAHCAVLSFMSDVGPVPSMMLPHYRREEIKDVASKQLIMASIDHAIWFHRPFCADEWLFYDCRVQSNSGARGLSFGKIYTQDGTLVASTCQEGLLRNR